MIARDPSLSRADIERLVRQWLWVRVDEAEKQHAAGGLKSLEWVQQKQVYGNQLEDELQSLLITNDLSEVSDLADLVLQRAGIELDRDHELYVLLCRGLLRAGAECARIIGARLAGRYDYQPVDALFANFDAPAQGSSIPSPGAAVEPPQLRVSTSVPLSELVARHLHSSKRLWDEQTSSQNSATFRMLSDWVGNPPAENVSRENVSGFLGALADLPSHYGQIRAYRGKTLPEMIKIARNLKDDGPRLTQKTLNRHASAISGLFTWAEKHGLWKGENPAKGFIDKRSTGKGPARRPWRKEEIEKLFVAPPWTGCKSEGQRLVRGKVVIRDGYFFIPLIALFGGLRMEEACKLCADDFRETESIPVIDVVGTVQGRVKEDASNRVVPIHPELTRIGLLDHVTKVRKSGGGHLWPELTRGGVGKAYSHNFSKWFSRLKLDIGVTDSKVVFHSFRRNVATALRGAGVPESVAADILGHEHKSMSYRVYSTGAAVRPLYDAICKIEYGLSLLHLHQPSGA